MLFNAKSSSISIDDSDMDYIRFGTGSRNLVLIPGLGDGLRTVKGTAFAMALAYKAFAKDYTVYVLSRKNQLRKGTTMQDIANDQAAAMRALGIPSAAILGVSQGGMIAQHLAIHHPEMVEKLVLVVTMARQNAIATNAITRWKAMAQAEDYKTLMTDTIERMYTPRRLKLYRLFYPIVTRIGKPKSFDRFIIQADAILQHDASGSLGQIACPTLVIGAENDTVLGAEPSKEIAHSIHGSKLLMYAEYGHGVYDEARDFNARVLAFLRNTAVDTTHTELC